MSGPKAVLCAGFSVLIFFSPFFFGAVHIWAFMALAACLFLLLALNPQALTEAENLPGLFKWACAVTLVFASVQAWSWAQDRHAALLQFLLWLALAAAFLLLQLLNGREVRTLLVLVVATALFQQGWSFWQAFQPVEKVLWRLKEAHQGYWTGTYLNRNHLAGLFEMALGISGGFLFSEALQLRRKKYAWVWCTVFLALLAGLLQTGSRFGCGLFLLFGLAAAIAVILKYPASRPWVLLLVLCGSLFFIFQSGVLFTRFIPDEGALESSSGRWWVWEDAWTLFLKHFFQGTGLGGFGRAFPQYQSARLLMGWEHAHNDYLELMIELGAPVFIIWVTGWTVLVIRMIRHAASAEMSQEAAPAGGAIAAMLALALHGFADFNFAIPANLFLFVLLAASAYRLLHLQKANRA